MTADAAKTLALLWRAAEPGPARRGRPQGLTVDAVVDTAIAVADADGLEAVAMRRIAQELGVVPMTLYTYVPGKAELLDLMLDRVYLAMERPGHSGGWRDRLTAVAEGNRALYGRHPWAAAIGASRPPLGPGLMAKYEYELRALDGCGLSDVDRDAALAYLLGFVQFSARAAAEAAAQAGTDEQWWAENGPLLERVLDPGVYPTAARVGTAAGEAQGGAFNPEHAWRFGVARTLDGLAPLIVE